MAGIISNKAPNAKAPNPARQEGKLLDVAGSGSRPTPSRYPIATSMDGIDAKTLGRDVPGSLK